MASVTMTNPEPLFKNGESAKLKSGSPDLQIIGHRFDFPQEQDATEMIVIYKCNWLSDINSIQNAEFYECQLNKLEG